MDITCTRERCIIEPEAAYIEVRLEADKFERVGFFGKGETLTSPTLNYTPISMDAVFG
ncbi:MAG: hypothetical protein IPO91_30150 [Chloroflexi bacterium]|nr:hypothetical protein [Chloroflexota bacterium]